MADLDSECADARKRLVELLLKTPSFSKVHHPPFDMSNEPACVANDNIIFSEYIVKHDPNVDHFNDDLL